MGYTKCDKKNHMFDDSPGKLNRDTNNYDDDNNDDDDNDDEPINIYI